MQEAGGQADPQGLEQALGGAAGIQGWLGLGETAAENASAAGMLAARQRHRGVGLELQHLPGLEFLSAKASAAREYAPSCASCCLLLMSAPAVAGLAWS